MASVADSAPSSSLLEHKEYDITSTCGKIICCCMLKSVLHLYPEEVVKKDETICGKSEKRMPYGELGLVEQSTCCFGICHNFTSNLSDAEEHGKKVATTPGCGCEGALVDEIVSELKQRMKGRGDTGNINRSEDAVRLMQHMNAKTKSILSQMQIPVPQNMTADDHEEHADVVFPHKDYVVTEWCRILCCGSKVLSLEPEEVQLVTNLLCCTDTKRFPYAQLQDVQYGNCCCCVFVTSPTLGTIQPGCGCEAPLTREIAQELRSRMKARGDTGNIRRQEFANQLSTDHDKMLTAIMEHLQIPVPALQAPQMHSM